MNFDDLQKVWDAQNQAPMYVLNETALEQIVQRKSRKAARDVNINDWGLMAIMIVCSAILLILDWGKGYTYFTAASMLGIAAYVGIKRLLRSKQKQDFEQSILGELEQAIVNAETEIKRARTFVWWMLLPVAIPSGLNMIQRGVSIWIGLLVAGMFALGWAVTQWGLKRKLLPRKRSLEALRRKLAENAE
ncbi:MAG: hypothetical protein AB8H47_00370 [Bacteroidia bacterium]